MGAPPDPTASLLQSLHAGDPAALASLVARHLPWLRQQVERRLGEFLRRHADPDDYLQDAVADFLRDAPRFQVRDEAQLRALLCRVVENTLRDRNDWFRARRRDLARNAPLPSDSVLALDPSLSAGTTPSGAAQRTEVREWVRLALELMDAEDRKVILARDYDDRSFVEIGDELGMTPNAVRMRWTRAVARLAALLKELRQGRIPEPTEP